MKSRPKHRRQFSFRGRVEGLEERLALSAVAPVDHAPPASHVVGVPALGHEHAEASPAPGRQVLHAAKHGAHHRGAAGLAPATNRWSWLANSYWYVPTSNLPAVLYNSSTGTLAPVSDQTVFHITGYQSGYFWGKTVTQLGSGSPSCTSLVGSVTPEGQVILTFTNTSGDSAPSITQGFGVMQRKFGQWTMENQMFTAPSSTFQIGHWAYMVQTRPGQPSWNSLPSSGLSVPEFLSQCDGTGPVPIGS
jgi:hypothetical protein